MGNIQSRTLKTLRDYQDPITSKACKDPVLVTTSDNKQRYWEAKTVSLAYRKQYFNKVSFEVIRKAISAGSLHLVTPKGCFDIFGGKRIISVELLSSEKKESYNKAIEALDSNLQRKNRWRKESYPFWFGKYYGSCNLDNMTHYGS